MSVSGDRTRGDPRAVVLIASASRRAGGLFTSVRRLWGELAKLGWIVEVHTVDDNASDEDRLGWKPVQVRYHRGLGPRRFGYSPSLWRGVKKSIEMGKQARGQVLISSHGLWMFTDLAGYWGQRRLGVTRIVQPHGMLEPRALRQSRLPKALAGVVWQTRSLRHATALVATSAKEVAAFRTAGYRGPVLILAHGVDVIDDSAPPPLAKAWPFAPTSRNLLFLSRIHPIKGLPLLLQSWGRLAPAFPDWQLIIAGPDERGHEREVKALSAQLGLEGRCSFVGPVYGAEKASLLDRADLFVLPTYSENFGLAVAEALAAGVPVVTTRGAPWARLEEMGCGWWVPSEVDALERALREAIALPSARLRAMGQRGRDWMTTEFSWSAVAAVADSAFRRLLQPHPETTSPACAVYR